MRVVYREYRPNHHLHVEFIIPPHILSIFRAEEWEGGWMWHAKAALTLYVAPESVQDIEDRTAFLKSLPRHGMTVTARWDYWPDEKEWKEVARRLASALVAIDHSVPVPA